MKTLSVVGTAAMFLVGGGILTPGMPGAHDLVHAVTHAIERVPAAGGVLAALAPLFIDALAGMVAGALILDGVTTARRLLR